METARETRRALAPGRLRRTLFPPASSLLLLFSLLSLYFGAGCTFERRPPVGEGEGGEELRLPSPEGSARAFLEDLGDARASGRAEDLRTLLHPEAEIVVGGRTLTLEPEGDLRAGGRAWSVLAPGADEDGEQREVSAVVLGDAAFFLYAGPTATESFLLVRDTTGWRLRLLHRAPAGRNGAAP